MFKTSGILEDYSCSVLCMFWLSYPVTMLKHADCVHNRCLCCEYSRFSLICNVLFHFFANCLIDRLFPTLSAEIDFILKQIKKLLFCYCTNAWHFFSDGKAFCLRNKYNTKLPSSSLKHTIYHKTQTQTTNCLDKPMCFDT